MYNQMLQGICFSFSARGGGGIRASQFKLNQDQSIYDHKCAPYENETFVMHA